MFSFKKVLFTASLILLTACQQEDKNIFKVGTIAGPETQLMEKAKEVAEKNSGLKIKIIEFTDYVEPNTALNDGSIEANMFQHQPYLDQQIKDRNYKIVSVGKTFVYPMGVYSSKLKKLNDLKKGDLVALPNDPSNEGRALLLLQNAGLLTLKKSAGLYATTLDIESNPRELKFKELDAAQLARSLSDVAVAVINTNYAIPAGLIPTKDAIYLEGKDSLYANIVVVRTDEQKDPRVKQLVDALQSQEVLDTANELFKGQAIPAWKN